MNEHTKKLRKVMVYKQEYKPEETRYVKVEDGTARFHQWGVDHVENDSGFGNFSAAIVERDDGTVEMVCSDLVRFLEEG